jgi:predicted NBD/HSP70 family sugar kinase
VRPNPRCGTVLALEITVDSLAVAAVGLGGETLDQARVDRGRDRISVDETIADLARLARVLLARLPERDSLIGVGVAVVGIVRRADGFVTMAPNLGWRDVSLGERLAAALDTTLPIVIANEADLGALAEVRRGAALGADHVLFLSGEVGVGGGLIVDGRAFTGVAGYGGEIGHMLVNPDGQSCRCGALGCWETEVGAVSLLRRAGRPPLGGRSEIDDLLADAQTGSPPALAALAETGHWLGRGLAGLVNLLNPRLVVFGGLFGRIHPFVAPIVDEELDRSALAAPRRLVRVVAGALGDEAPLRGAAELAFEPLLVDPTPWFGSRARGMSTGPQLRLRRVVA